MLLSAAMWDQDLSLLNSRMRAKELPYFRRKDLMRRQLPRAMPHPPRISLRRRKIRMPPRTQRSILFFELISIHSSERSVVSVRSILSAARHLMLRIFLLGALN